MKNSLFRIETLTGPPITISDAQVYVRSQVVQLRFPGLRGGLIWNRPVATVLRRWGGQEKRIPILDITRIALFTMTGLCFTGTLIYVLLKRKKSKA